MSKKKILYLGTNGFPFGLAQVQRQIMISKMLIDVGFSVTILNTNPVRNNSHVRYKGIYEGIHYIYTCLTSRYIKSFIIRNLIKTIGKINETIIIIITGLFKPKDIVIFTNTLSFYQLKYYYFLTRLIRGKLIYDYVEYIGALKSKPSIFKNNNKIFDNSIYRFSDRIICISEYLLKKIKKINHNLITIKIPAITDFNLFDKITDKVDQASEYFLFCGSVNYTEIIEFIISTFELIKYERIRLIIITNGSEDKIIQLKKRITFSHKKESIIIISNLSFNQLISYYKGAKGLLIPLLNCEKDRARFPHKISEYTAAGKPIITTNIGEISIYFEDKVNALISKDFTAISFAEKMNYLIENPEEGARIGKNSRILGEKYFYYKVYSNSIYNFINK